MANFLVVSLMTLEIIIPIICVPTNDKLSARKERYYRRKSDEVTSALVCISKLSHYPASLHLSQVT